MTPEERAGQWCDYCSASRHEADPPCQACFSAAIREAEAAMKERCAKAAEEYGPRFCSDEFRQHQRRTAAAIRALGD